MKKLLYSISILLTTHFAFAQQPQQIPCGTDLVYKELIKERPELEMQMQQYNQAFLNYVKTIDLNSLKATPVGTSAKASVSPKYIIPVVFHILHYNDILGEHYSDGEVLQELANMNAAYSANAPYRSRIRPMFKDVEGDARIQFRLAKMKIETDKDGTIISRTPTTGIEHIYVGPLTGKANDFQKKNSWAPDKYLNIWVCQSLVSGGGFAAGGYAYFPTSYPSASVDGPIVSNRIGVTPPAASGNPFSLITCVHETGHYLGLLHPFNGASATDSCGDDYCYDTPPVFYTPYGTANNPHYANVGAADIYSAPSTCTSPYLPDQWENFMDYYNGSATCNMFTIQQVARMHFTLENYRRNLWQPENLDLTGVSDTLNTPLVVPVAAFSIYNNQNLTDVRTCVNSQVIFKDNTYNTYTTPTAYEWNFGDGASPATSSVANPPVVTYSTPGYKTVSLKVTNANGSNTKTAEKFIYIEGPADTRPHVAAHSADWDWANDFLDNGWHFENESPYAKWIRTAVAAYDGYASLELPSLGTQNQFNYSLISPPFDLTGSASPYFEFYYAFAPNFKSPPKTDNTQDALSVLISTDCGKTWSSPRVKVGGNAFEQNSIPASFPAESHPNPLSTNPSGTTPNSSLLPVTASLNFIPSGKEQWRKMAVLSNVIPTNVNSVKFKIVYSCFGGNNLYIDRLAIGMNTGINDITASDFRVGLMPNPFSSIATLTYTMPLKGKIDIRLYDIIGKEIGTVYSGMQDEGGQEVEIDRNKYNLHTGIYFVKLIVNGTKEVTHKLVIN